MAVTEPSHAYRPSYSSTVRAATPDLKPVDSKPLREDKFAIQFGSKLHSYGRDKAPYPLTYNREDLELGVLDLQVIHHTKHGSNTFLDFKDKHPKRCLDLGTGLGTWVIDAAKEWPECTFVGYDLMNVQIPLRAVPQSISERITWIHGNILRTRLPFDDEEFDHVHLSGMAFAVPENKWMSVYEEIRRVMRTGGTIEQIEEDAIFPVLPRWFTEPLHAHSRGPYIHRPDGSQQCLPPSPVSQREASHEHALLESLFYDVFENRFINPTPTSTLPSYFSACFGHVFVPPVLTHPMPPFAPFAPLPAAIATPQHSMGVTPQREHFAFLSPVPDVSSDMNLSIPTASTSTLHSECSSFESSAANTPPRTPSIERSSSVASTVGSLLESDRHSTGSSRSSDRSMPSGDLRKGSTSIGWRELFPIENILALDEQSLNMQLFRALGLVMAAKEAMWEELMVRVVKVDQRLRQYGWEDRDFAEASSRVKFETMVEQYQKDVRARVSIWHSMVLNGWEYPRQDPITRAEMADEERLRQDILEARRSAKGEHSQAISRAMRLLVGTKVPMEHVS